MTRSELKQLLAENQTKKALDGLQKITGQLGDPEIQNEVILQSAKYNDYLKEKAAGTKSQENLDIQKANIDAALMYIVDKLPAFALPSADKPDKTSGKEAFSKFRLPLLAGIGVILLLVIIFKPSVIGLGGHSSGAPFEYTVNVRGPILQDYPPLEGSILSVQLDNHWVESKLNKFGDADFKGIPSGFAGKGVLVQLKSDYWEQTHDSIWLEGKTAILEARPNGKLGTVSGVVRSGDGSDYLQGVEIRLENSNLSVLTDSAGYFALQVPEGQQKLQYSLTASKEGYTPETLFAVPTSGNVEIRLQPKK